MAEGAIEPLEHLIAMPLDVDLICSVDLLGRSFPIEVAGLAGRVVLPRMSAAVSSDGTLLVDPPVGFDRIRHTMLSDGGWGAFTAGTGPDAQVAIAALGFEFILDPSGLQIAPEEFPSSHLRGTGPLIGQTRDWLRRLMRWSQVLTNQPTDLNDPSPLLVSRRSDGALHWMRHRGYESLTTTSATSQVVGMAPPQDPRDALCERLIDEPTLHRLLELANDPDAQAPTAVMFLAEARLAGLRQRHRLAMIAVATGLESLIGEVTGVGTSTSYTLGRLIGDSRVTSKIQLPSDTKSAVVQPRADAVHRGTDPSRATLLRAVEILDGLVRTYHPEFAYDPALRRAHRPANLGTVTLVAPSKASAPPQ